MNVVEPTCSNGLHPDEFLSGELESNTFPAFQQHSQDYRREIDLFNRAEHVGKNKSSRSGLEAGKAIVREAVSPRFPLAYQKQGEFLYLPWNTIHHFTGTYWNTYSLTRFQPSWSSSPGRSRPCSHRESF